VFAWSKGRASRPRARGLHTVEVPAGARGEDLSESADESTRGIESRATGKASGAPFALFVPEPVRAAQHPTGDLQDGRRG
jgi:hypothetical protein